MIPPQEIALHYFWSNFVILPLKIKTRGHLETINNLQTIKGFNLDNYNGIDKIKTLRNCVEPKAGLHILSCSFVDIKNVKTNKVEGRLF